MAYDADLFGGSWVLARTLLCGENPRAIAPARNAAELAARPLSEAFLLLSAGCSILWIGLQEHRLRHNLLHVLEIDTNRGFGTGVWHETLMCPV